MAIVLGEQVWHQYWNTVRPKLNKHVHSLVYLLDLIFHHYEIWRVSRRTTRVLGRRWRRARRRLEVDLTYACNLRCNDCNRSVPQAPSSAHLSQQQIRACIDESVAKGYRWDLIRLLGGEPTLHPEFLEIVELLRDYRRTHARSLKIEVITNGYGAKVSRILALIPDDIVVRNTQKASSIQGDFEPFNRAPCDLPEHGRSDYSNGCWISEYCGMGLTPSGYYHCAVAGGIDRVFGLGIGRKSIPDVDDRMHDEMSSLCRLCGHFCKQLQPVPERQRISESWRTAYARWHANAGHVRRRPPALAASRATPLRQAVARAAETGTS